MWRIPAAAFANGMSRSAREVEIDASRSAAHCLGGFQRADQQLRAGPGAHGAETGWLASGTIRRPLAIGVTERETCVRIARQPPVPPNLRLLRGLLSQATQEDRK
jgi:hypothetical protein